MRRKYQLGVGSALLFLGLLTATIFVAFWSASRYSLLNCGTRILSTSIKKYFWKSDNLLIYTSFDQTIPACTVFQYEIVSCRKVPLLNVNHKLPLLFKLSITSLSSDNSRLLYLPGPDSDLGFSSIALKNNNVMGQFASNGGDIFKNGWISSNPLWSSNGNRCFFLKYVVHEGFYVMHESFDPPKLEQGPCIGVPLGTTFWDEEGSTLLGFISRDHILALPMFSELDTGQSGRLSLYEFSIGNTPDVRQYSIPVQKHSRIVAVALSPKGDRLALLTFNYNPPPYIVEILGRWLPAFQPKSHPIIELSTCRPDGAKRKRIGEMPATEDPDRAERSLDLQWLPGGKQVSFIHNKSLWTVPID